jgi:hypothetical protein
MSFESDGIYRVPSRTPRPGDTVARLQEALAKASPDTLGERSTDPNTEVRVVVAGLAHCPADALVALAVDEVSEVRLRVAALLVPTRQTIARALRFPNPPYGRRADCRLAAAPDCPGHEPR